MKKLAVFFSLFACLLIVACSSDDAAGVDQLHGQWVIDMDSTVALLNKDKAMSPQELNMVKMMFSSFSFEFDTKKMKMNVALGGQTTEADFKVVKINGNKFTIDAQGEVTEVEIKDNKLYFAGNASNPAGIVLIRK